MIYATVVLVAAFATSVFAYANAPPAGPCTVYFTHSLTPAFVADLHAQLGLPLDSLLPPLPGNGIRMFLDAEREQLMRARFGAVIRQAAATPPAERCAPRRPNAVIEGMRVFLHPAAAVVLRTTMTTTTTTTLSSLTPQRALAQETANLLGNLRNTTTTATLSLSSSSLPAVIDDDFVDMPLPDGMLSDDLALAAASLPGVYWVEPRIAVHAVNLWAASTVQRTLGQDGTLAAASTCHGTAACAPVWTAGLRGQGQIIGHADTGIAATCLLADAANRPVPVCAGTSAACVPQPAAHDTVVSYWHGTGGDLSDGDVVGHGTHTAGTLVGGGAAGSELFSGVAPAAKLAFVDVQTGAAESLAIPQPYGSALLGHMYRQGARISSGSWGANVGYYTSQDASVDLFCWENRDFLPLFAAGNDGPWADSILSPAMAKNALAVAAAMNGLAAWQMSGQPLFVDGKFYASGNWTADWSSRGGAAQQATWPKPDISAPGGEYVWSAKSTCTGTLASVSGQPTTNTVRALGGTSMATPAAAGAAALMRQWLVQERGIAVPKASLMRALIVASARPGQGAVPNGLSPTGAWPSGAAWQPYGGRQYGEGFGTITAAVTLSSVALLNNEQAAATFTAPGQIHAYCGGVPPPTPLQPRELVVVLAWTDYPSAVTAAGRSVSLVNDLDVHVDLLLADGTMQAWHLPNGLATRDSRAVTERIVVPLPVGQRVGIVIRVLSQAVSLHPQTYSLVAMLRGGGTLLVDNGRPADASEGTEPFSVLADTRPANAVCFACGDGTWRRSCGTTAKPTPLPANPTPKPTSHPTAYPTPNPTARPTIQPTLQLTVQPTVHPTVPATAHPTVHPTVPVTFQPTVHPTPLPTSRGSGGGTPPPPTTVVFTPFPTVQPTPIPTQRQSTTITVPGTSLIADINGTETPSASGGNVAMTTIPAFVAVAIAMSWIF